jgi:O-antigen ligase
MPRSFSAETLAAWHVGALVVFASWAFGGNIGWAQTALTFGGGIGGLFIALLALRERLISSHGSLRLLHGLWPLLVFNVLALISAAHPSFRQTTIEGAAVLVPLPIGSGIPSSAQPAQTLSELWLFDAVFLSCFNLAFAVRRRRVLRMLLIVIGSNAVVLAVFGSLQKLLRAEGLFFGRVVSPNNTFFASFIYHNHWGAFAVLMIGVCLAWIFQQTRRQEHRDFWHSPGFGGLVASLFLAATIPLSGSRSCTALALILLGIALLHGLRRVTCRRRDEGRSAAVPVLAVVVDTLLATGFIYQLARRDIEARLADTREQIAHAQNRRQTDARIQLYRDTVHMAKDRPWFGWGIGSYGTVFMLYNQQVSNDRLPVFYESAHSDWLQAVAETGVTGTMMLVALAAIPLLSIRRALPLSAAPSYLLAGCGLILLYALIEFPFGSPAVMLAFGACFFTAVRWAEIDQRDRQCT